MTSRPDGGQVAFIGFLYQMVGTLALRAWASMSHPPDASGNLDALLAVVGEGDIHHEDHEIDALVRRLGLDAQDTCVLLQFKFTHDPQKYPITPGDLAKICERFQASVAKWPAERQAISTFRVITNRPPSPTLIPLLAQPVGSRSHKEFSTPELAAMLQQVEVISDLTVEMFADRLTRFAAEFGTRSEEFAPGLHQLIGDLVTHASLSSAPPITTGQLAQAFRGFPNPARLTAEQVCQSTASTRRKQLDMLGVPTHPGLPIRRKLLGELRDIARQTGFIVLKGEGGNGKSVLAWQLIDEILRDTDSGKGSLAAFLEPYHIESEPLSWLVGEWQNAPDTRRQESMTTAFERIQAANPGATPSICLVIDGLDEAKAISGHEIGIDRAITWFWAREQKRIEQNTLVSEALEPPSSVLIVTARDDKKVKELWLHGALSHALRSHPPCTFSVGEFSEDEALDAAEQLMPDQHSQLVAAFQTTASHADNVGVGATPALHPEIKGILTHPAMWYAMSALSDTERMAVLAGQPTALRALAREFLHWFVTKICSRRSEWQGDDVLDALKQVGVLAAATKANQFAYDLWKQPASGEQLVGSQRLRLYDEALSAGVIREAERKRRWYWRHSLIGNRLAQLATEEHEGEAEYIG